MINKNIAILMMGVFLVALSPAQAASKVELFHIHGLSYSSDGEKLFVPRHYGLAIYEKGKWRSAPGPQHDYMGFVGTRDRFYSSGHPAQGSGLVNPFGLMKSEDDGQQWQSLGMAGESDFHVLAASYDTNLLFLENLAPNSRIPFAGLATSDDEGKTFRRAAGRGATEAVTLAVHPLKPEQVAMGGQEGLFLSTNRGDDFRQVKNTRGVYALWYDLNGKDLWFGGSQFSPYLALLDLASGDSRALKIPRIEQDDAVAYIAQNPVHQDEITIATFQRHVFTSRDRGATWNQIAVFGETK